MNAPNAPRIRPLAVCLCHADGKLCLVECHDRLKDETFYRAIGGD